MARSAALWGLPLCFFFTVSASAAAGRDTSTVHPGQPSKSTRALARKKIQPEFSWATLPVAWHSGNSTGRYTDEQIRDLARYQMVTFEKFQNLRAVVPTAVLARGYESPGGLYECQRNASLRLCGCCLEDEIVAVARKIKSINPKVVTIAYFNAEIGYPWYRATRELARNPSWWSSAHQGPPGATWKSWNLTVAAAAAAWQHGCAAMTETGVVDSCFVDGCNDWGSSLGAAAKRNAIAKLQAAVPGPLLCGVGGRFTERELLKSGAKGVQDESWGLIDQETGKTTFATREIPGLMAAVRARLVFQAHGRAVCGVAGKPCENRTEPCWSTIPDYHDPAVQTELAAFLVAMGEYSYYVCGSWENYPANMSTWNPVYDLPLGKPQGDALLGKDLVWRRTFTSGTSVSFDTKTNTGLVSWASRPRATTNFVKQAQRRWQCMHPHMVLVATQMLARESRPFCIDQYEAAVDVNGKRWPFNMPVDRAAIDGRTVAVTGAAPRRPQAYISAVQAAAACAAAGKRLCELSEWLAACRGPKNYTYPYGNVYVPGACNEGRLTNPVNDVFGSNATFNRAEMDDSRLDTLPHTVAPGGNFSRCVSVFESFDMHGNLHEWVSTRVSTGARAGHGIFKGGFFVDARINGPGCLYETTAHDPTYHDYSNGFRCCVDAEQTKG